MPNLLGHGSVFSIIPYPLNAASPARRPVGAKRLDGGATLPSLYLLAADPFSATTLIISWLDSARPGTARHYYAGLNPPHYA